MSYLYQNREIPVRWIGDPQRAYSSPYNPLAQYYWNQLTWTDNGQTLPLQYGNNATLTSVYNSATPQSNSNQFITPSQTNRVAAAPTASSATAPGAAASGGCSVLTAVVVTGVVLTVLATAATVAAIFLTKGSSPVQTSQNNPTINNTNSATNMTTVTTLTTPTTAVTCASYQYHCINGRCIYQSWVCDGVKDCFLGDDESNCSNCNSSTQWTCLSNYACIPSQEVCDGTSNCADSSDEANCLLLTQVTDMNGVRLVNAIYQGVGGFYICADNWNSAWSNLACMDFGDSYASVTSNITIMNDTSALLTLSNPSTLVTHVITSLKMGVCQSHSVIGLTCVSSACGTRTVAASSVGPYIIDGQQAKKGAWPWQALVLGLHPPTETLCGGSLINNQWVITAAHCVVNSSTGELAPLANAVVYLGTLLSSHTNQPGTVQANVAQIFVNPNYTHFKDPTNFDNDIALIQLKTPVSFTQTVIPICLPSSTVDLSQFRVCVATGFGDVSPTGPISTYLLQAKMMPIPYQSCVQYLEAINVGNPNVASSLIDAKMICIGTLPTLGNINVCSGDSGGPFACEDEQGRWTLIGVINYAYDSCGLSVVGRVSAYVTWINSVIGATSP